MRIPMIVVPCLWGVVASAAIPKMKNAVVDLKDFVLDKPYRAMEGPIQTAFLKVDPEGEKYIWVTGTKVVALEKDGREVNEYLCHSRTAIADTDSEIENLHQIKADNGMAQLIAISQGVYDVELPPGFGMIVPLGKKGIVFGAQVQDPEHAGPPKKIDVRATVRYLKGSDGVKAGLRRLKVMRFEFASLPAVIGQENRRRHDHTHHGHDEGLFMVPPGHHVYSGEVNQKKVDYFPETSKVHYIRAHLHAYAKSIELIDATENKSLWKGFAKTSPKTKELDHIDVYSSVEGFRVYKNHKYKLNVEYDNPTEADTDAMAFLMAYYEPKSKR